MPASVLLDQAKSDRWPLGFDSIDKVRIQPDLAAVFDDARPATVGKGDFLLHSALKCLLITAIVDGRWREVYRTLGRLLGLDGTSVPARDNCHP